MSMHVRKLQLLRRTVQVLVVAFIVTIPAVARYNNYLAAYELDRVLEKWSGTLQGSVLSSIDSTLRFLPDGEVERAGRMQRNRKLASERAQTLRGGAWSAEIGPVSMSDPLAGAESVAASKKFPKVLAISLLLPVLLTLLFGRVFCSWICPMGLLLEMTDKLRMPLRFLELHPRNLRVSRGTKYGLLAAGLLLTAVLAVPVLGYVYPPAMLSRELHGWVFKMFDRAELGKFGFWVGGIGWTAGLLLAIVVIEVSVSRRWWCRYVCPGGALYSLIGWARPVRVKLKQTACTDCALCVAACPMGLNPMKNAMGIECDSCGECISSCNDDALAYGTESPLWRREDADAAIASKVGA
jgi:NapH/MauN family ferredoxin-type protein